MSLEKTITGISGGREFRYAFEGVDRLIADFRRDIERIQREDRST